MTSGILTSTTPYVQSTGNTRPAEEAQRKEATGSGLVGSTGPAPDPQSPSYQALMSSIVAMLPEISSEMVDVMLVEVMHKKKNTQLASDTDRIKIDQEKKRGALAEKEAKLEEATKKIEDAAEKQKNASIWDKIKLAFQFVGALLAIAVGSILAAVPGMQAIAALMIIGGVVGLIMAIDSAVQMGTGNGIMGSIVMAATNDPEKAQWADFGFRIGMAVVGIALAAATFFVNPAGAVSSAVQAAQTISSIVQASIGIATGVGDITTGVMRYQASQEKADASDLQADAKSMEALIQAIDDLIDQAIARMVAASGRFNDMMDALTDAIQDRGNSLSQAKFGI